MRSGLWLGLVVLAVAGSAGAQSDGEGAPDAKAPDVVVDEQGNVLAAPIDPATIDGLVEKQAPGTLLASEVLGSDVATSAGGVAVGTIDDLIMDQDGRLSGVVVSTGGFLGFGEGRFGVALDQIERDSEWNLYVLNWSPEEVDATPDFVTLSEQNK